MNFSSKHRYRSDTDMNFLIKNHKWRYEISADISLHILRVKTCYISVIFSLVSNNNDSYPLISMWITIYLKDNHEYVRYLEINLCILLRQI